MTEYTEYCPDDDCGGEIDTSEGHPFGSDVQCKLCKRWWATEWEQMRDSMPWWMTGEPGEEE